MFKNLISNYKLFRPVIIIAIATFFIELGFSIVNWSALPVYFNYELHAVHLLGIILGVQFLFDTLSRPFLGAIGDRTGRRLLVIVGPILTAITALITVHISIGILFVLRIIDGIAAGALWTSVYAETSDITEEKQRNTAMSIINIAYISAMALGPLFGGLVAPLGKYFRHPTEPAFILSGIIFFLGAIIAYFIFKPTKNIFKKDGQKFVLPFKLKDLSYSFRQFPTLIALAFLIFFAVGLIGPLAKIYALDRYGVSELQLGYVLAIVALSLGAFAVPLSRAGNRWGEHKAFFWGLFLSVIAIWIITYSSTVLVALSAAAIFGLSFVLAFPAWLSLISKLAPPNRKGEVLGVVGLSQGVGMLIGTALSGIFFGLKDFRFDTLGIYSLNLSFFIASVLLTFSIIFSYFWIYRARPSFKRVI